MKLKRGLLLSVMTLMLITMIGPLPAPAMAATASTTVLLPIAERQLTLSGPTSDSSGTLTSASTTLNPYAPQPGDDKLQKDKVFLDFKSSHLVVLSGAITKVSVVLKGYMSDPCHQLRVVYNVDKTTQRIYISVYSVFDPNLACIDVIQYFTATVGLGSFTSGYYNVYVNGQLLGSFRG